MEFGISTPALLFSAISLLLLAYTNRFLAIANLVRQFVKEYDQHPEDRILTQLRQFSLRLRFIKYTQLFGVLSFLFCVVSMFLVMLGHIIAAEVLFSISLVTMMTSLVLSLGEVLMSISGLKVELQRIEPRTRAS